MILDILRLIHRIREHLGDIHSLLDLPDLNDPQAVYQYSLQAMTVAAKLAMLTPTQYDDIAIRWVLANMLASFESFHPWYQLFRAIYEIIDSDESAEAVAHRALHAADENAVAQLYAGDIKLSPITIITVIVEVIRLIRSLTK